VVHGVADYVLTGGRIVVDDGQLRVVQGAGKFVPNPPFSAYVYDQVRAREEERQREWVPVQRSEEDMAVPAGGRKASVKREAEEAARAAATQAQEVATNAALSNAAAAKASAGLATAFAQGNQVEEELITETRKVSVGAAEGQSARQPAEAEQSQPDAIQGRSPGGGKTQIRVRNPPGGKSSIFF